MLKKASMSFLSKKKKKLSFSEAIVEIIKGKKITKSEWNNKKIYGFLNRDILSLHKTDNKNYQWVVRSGDLLGKDWIALD